MKKFSEIVDFVRYDLWRRTSTDMDSRSKRIGYSIIRTVVLVVRGFTSKDLTGQPNHPPREAHNRRGILKIPTFGYCAGDEKAVLLRRFSMVQK